MKPNNVFAVVLTGLAWWSYMDRQDPLGAIVLMLTAILLKISVERGGHSGKSSD